MVSCSNKLLPLFLLQVACWSSFLGSTQGNGLSVGFYFQSCPQAEAIIRRTVESYFSQDPTVSAPLLRLHFHDCFVRVFCKLEQGCDGSVLLNSTGSNLAEKDAKPNLTLDGFYVIDAAKAALEKACPGTVSCADILALAARDAVSLATGLGKGINLTRESQLYQVETGRRDGSVSRAREAAAHLPSSDDNIAILKANFRSKGLNSTDLAILSGGHAIGNSHCFSFEKRLHHHYDGRGLSDATLDANYKVELLRQCEAGNDTVVEMVPGSSTTFDAEYYGLVSKQRGLFHSDEALLEDEVTRGYVYSRKGLPESIFFADFGVSMVKMGRAGVLTGSSGEIRKNCALVNH